LSEKTDQNLPAFREDPMPTYSMPSGPAVWRSTEKYLRQSIITDPDPRAHGAKWRVTDRRWCRLQKIWVYYLVQA
jgi:hypothetical protein